MKKQAFTLIELLVVVLIIGILSAIALPQYQKAIDKARLTQLIVLANAANVAAEEYYLANGSYTDQWNQLSISAPGNISGAFLTQPQQYTLQLRVKSSSGPDAVIATDARLPGMKLYFAHKSTTYGAWKGGRRACYADSDNARAVQLCRTVTGKTTRDATAGGSQDIYWFDAKSL